MKFIRNICIVLLGLFILGTNNLVKAGGEMDEIEGFGKYSKYKRGDEFATFIFADVPDNLITQVREWVKTDEGRKQGFHKENGGRNAYHEEYERLADKAYGVLGILAPCAIFSLISRN